VGAAQLESLAAEIPLIAGPAGHVALGMGGWSKRGVQDFAERKL
jgi:TRAP-type mannitol/chloroaromatic compound transport system substrate-binding protein